MKPFSGQVSQGTLRVLFLWREGQGINLRGLKPPVEDSHFHAYYLGKIPIFTSIFFKGVGEKTTNEIFISQLQILRYFLPRFRR